MSQQLGESYQVYKNYDKKAREMYYTRYSMLKNQEVLNSFLSYVDGNYMTGFEFFAFKLTLEEDVYISSYCLDLFERVLEMDPYIADAKTMEFQGSDGHEIYIKLIHMSSSIDILRDRIAKLAEYFFDGAY